MARLLLGLGKNRENPLFGRTLVRVRAKIEKKTAFSGKALVRVMAKVEKNTFFGRALVRIRAK